MATYAIGDIQGCQRELEALLALIAFDPASDRLWLTGDLVNRGPHSLGVVRSIMALGACATSVLGNHDLHLLALALVPGQAPRRRDTVTDILAAPDRDAIVAWLRRLPLVHIDPAQPIAMVHAGVPPPWDLDTACARAAEVERVLRDDDAVVEFLASMYGNTPRLWRDDLQGAARLRYITNCLTRMRYCDAAGGLDLAEKGAPAATTGALAPWFAHPARRARDTTLVFGHWSTLRLSLADSRRHNVYALDTGAVWGGRLTALRLDDRMLFSVSSSTAAPFD